MLFLIARKLTFHHQLKYSIFKDKVPDRVQDTLYGADGHYKTTELLISSNILYEMKPQVKICNHQEQILTSKIL